MTDTKPVAYEQTIMDVLQYLGSVGPVIETHGLDQTVVNLVLLRASQLNGCVWCLDMHLKEARSAGETQTRIDKVAVWENARDFDDRERAALSWSDALTHLDPHTDYGALRARLRQHFSDEQIGALTATVAIINMWNRINVSRH